MKSNLGLITLAVVLTIVSAKIPLPRNVTTHSAKVWLVKTITFSYVDRLVKELRNVNSGPVEGKATILPPFPDPVVVAPGEVLIDIPLDFLDPPVTITGNLQTTTDLEIAGLSAIVDDFQLVIITGRVSWDLSVPSVALSTSAYNMHIEVKTGEEVTTTIDGSGDIAASVSDVFLHILANVRLTGLLLLRTLELDVGFKELSLNGGDATIDGEPIDWGQLSTDIQEFFDAAWTDNDEFKTVFTEAVRCSIDHVINGCTLAGLPGDPSCLKVELNMDCLEPFIPTGPTVAPTTGPTIAPTTGPTVAPTTGPTVAPTTGPTVAPTTGPTSEPTSPTTPTTTASGYSTVSNAFIVMIVSLVARLC